MATATTSKSRWKAIFKAAIKRRSASIVGLIFIVLFGALGSMQVIANEPLVIGIAAIVIFEFQKQLDKGVPLLQLTCLIASLQWLVGPMLSYNYPIAVARYTMYVPQEHYFSYALPATAFFVAVMLATGASVHQQAMLAGVHRRQFFATGIVLNIVANVAGIIAPRFGESGLAFFFHLISQLRYVGALYFLFSPSPIRLVLAALSCTQLFVSSLGTGMFHDLILWLAIIFCYWFAQKKWSFFVKLAVLSIASAALFSIQAVKAEYRSLMRSGTPRSIVTLIYEYVVPTGRAWDNDVMSISITRLNQGWIISAIMQNVPEFEPFAEGETVKEAILASALPRFIWSEKKAAGGRENFRRFTGLEIAEGTSMGISPLGEAYANYAVTGGIAFMIAFGAFFALIYYGTLRYCIKHPTFFFWLPLIFYQAMKAETELLVVMNQVFKGAMVAFAGHYVTHMHFKARRAIAAPSSSTALNKAF